MTDINSVTITGRLVRDPQIYPCENGIGLATFTIASTRDYLDRDGKPQIGTSYILCKASGALASVLSGRKQWDWLVLSGQLESESWESNGEILRQLSLVCLTVLVPTTDPETTSKTETGGGRWGSVVLNETNPPAFPTGS